jgi:hypothetical protein
LGLIRELPDEVQIAVLVPVVRAGGKVVKTGAKFLAPVDEGDLQASIDQVERSYPNSRTAISVVGPRSDYKRNGKRPAKTGHLAEFGHTAVNGRFVPGTPYMRPAVKTAESAAVQPMYAAAEKGLEKATDKLVRKYGHRKSA